MQTILKLFAAAAAVLLAPSCAHIPAASQPASQASAAAHVAEAERLAQMMGKPSLQGLTLVATVPAQHSYGFESSVLLAMLGGAAFESGRPFYPADIVDSLQRVPRPRALVTTPFHLKTLLAAGVEHERRELSAAALLHKREFEIRLCDDGDQCIAGSR